MTHRNPAALRIAQTLRERIETGGYQPGTWLPPERSLAEEFGVDRSVIRAVLSALTDQGLVVRNAGRRPWVNDRLQPESTRTGGRRTPAAVQNIVALLPHQGHFASSMAILRGINHTLRLRDAGCRLQISDNFGDDAYDSIRLEKKAIAEIENEGVAGVILWHMGGPWTLAEFRHLTAKGVPVIFIDRRTADFDGDFVGVDNLHSAQKAVNHLLDLGHTRIGHLTHSDWASPVLERCEGYRDALLLRGIQPRPEWIADVHAETVKTRGPAAYFFGLPDPPTAVFAVNDDLAYALIADVERLGKRVPEDLSVIGFDNSERFSPRPALLTTMHNPFELVGQRAAELLLRRLSSREQAKSARHHLLLETSLVERCTTRALPAR